MRGDWIRLMIAAARLPLRREPANDHLERPITYGRTVNIRDLAQDVGLKTASIYYPFPSEADVCITLVHSYRGFEPLPT